MIYDKLSNLGFYRGINKNLDTAIDYILTHDLNELPIGKNIVDGDNVFINVMEAKAFPLEEREYELHKNYFDIQMDLVGVERVDTGNREDVTVSSYNEVSDVAVCDASYVSECIIGPGNFIICMPNEPHKPNIQVTEDTYLKKAVCKVRL